MDKFDNKDGQTDDSPLNPLNIKKKLDQSVAIAIEDGTAEGYLPHITAAGRGKIAEQILQLAFENGVRVREDSALAEMLAAIEIDSPIPSEAFMAVAEILCYVYRANGEPNPFDAVFKPETLSEKPKEDL